MYKHDTLATRSTIRLLILAPGEFGRPIHISLFQHDVRRPDPDLQFEALSYAWGDQTHRMPVFCDSEVILVGNNLFTALQYLRSQDLPRHLWVDAVCINQEDSAEKAFQIPLMKDIYSRAHNVVTWLGEEDESSAKAFETITSWAAWVDTPGKLLGECIFEGPDAYVENLRARESSLRILFKRPWFVRAWTLQEVYLARDAIIVCGNLDFDLAALLLAFITASKTNFGDLFDDVRDVLSIWYTLSGPHASVLGRESGYPLSALLHLTQLRKAGNLQDRMYSLLGLVDGPFVKALSPSYTTSTAETYIQYTRAMIEDDKRLNILSDIERGEGGLSLPSWVPDWSANQRTHSLAAPDDDDDNDNDNKFCINDQVGILFKPGWRCNDHKLDLEGAHIDHIVSTYDIDDVLLVAGTKARKNVNALAEWRSHFEVLSELVAMTGTCSWYWPTSEAIEIAVLRTLCTDRSPLSVAMPSSLKSSRFSWHNRAILKRACFPRRNSEGNVSRDHVPGPGDSNSDDQDDQDGRNSSRPRASSNMDDLFESLGREEQWTASADDIRSVYYHCIAEEKATRRARLARRRLSLPQVNRLQARAASNEAGIKPGRIVHEAFEPILRQCLGRCLVVTAQGLIGLAPADARADDSIYTLIGGAVPFVLRRTQTDTEFSLIGEAYVHGIMYGELWRKAPRGRPILEHRQPVWRKVTLV